MDGNHGPEDEARAGSAPRAEALAESDGTIHMAAAEELGRAGH